MRASPSDQRQIIDVAAFDQKTTALNHTASTLPEIAELVTTTTKSHNARDLRIAAETELNDLKRELGSLVMEEQLRHTNDELKLAVAD